jgi:CheY-like chemotaxis protein
MMGGSVTVASEMQRGSLFRLRFPNVAISGRLPKPDLSMKTVATNFNCLRPSTVLGVDDKESNRQLLRAMLSDSHHRLLLACNGREAIELARQEKPDLILLDVRMPEMDGCQVLEALREIPALKLTPVIAVTASILITEENKIKPRFNGYMQKPYSRRELFDELARFLPTLEPSDAAVDIPPVPAPPHLSVLARPALISAGHESAMLPEENEATSGLRLHDLKSPLAGVVMSAELLLERAGLLHDPHAERSVTEILCASRRLLKFLKESAAFPRATASPFTAASPAGGPLQKNQLSALVGCDFTDQVRHLQTEARQLYRQLSGVAEARPVELAENIVRSCAELAHVVEKFAPPSNARQTAKPACLGLPQAAARVMRRYRQRARHKSLTLLTPSLTTHGLSSH